MILRDFKKEDAQIIAGWLQSEEELYKWSADRFNKYPLSGNDINENYAPQLETGRFYPLTAIDDNGNVLGHFIIRYPQDDDDYLDKLEKLAGNSDTIVFLGHGSSGVLYGVNFNELIYDYNVDMLRGKNLVLFACNSVGFIQKFGLPHALGFGIVPTSDYDAETGKLHSLNLKVLTLPDISYIQQAIVRIWQKTLRTYCRIIFIIIVLYKCRDSQLFEES